MIINWRSDLIWNYSGLILMAISGALINFILIAKFDAAYLGFFNIGFAFYLILGQLGAGGVQHALFHYIAKNIKNTAVIQTIISHGFYIILTYGFILSCLWYLASGPIAQLTHKLELTTAFKILTPALFLFVLNKVLLMICNGLQRMKEVAIGQTIRYVTLMLVIVVCGFTEASINWTFSSFFIAETAVSCFLIFSLKDYLFNFVRLNRRQVTNITTFGFKALPIGALIEINTRVDVLLLSHFVSATEVGLYSFVAMIAEGLLLLLAIVRNQVNPYIAFLVAEDKPHNLLALIKSLRRYLYIGALMCFVLVNLLYPLVIEWLLPDRGLSATIPLLLILSTAFLLVAGYLPFDQVLTMSGFPGLQSLQCLIIVGSNIILSLLLIPIGGIYGVAIAAALANSVVVIVALKYLVKRNLKLAI